MKHGLKNEKSLNMDQDALVDPRLLKEIKCSTNFLHSPIQTTCSVLCAVLFYFLSLAPISSIVS